MTMHNTNTTPENIMTGAPPAEGQTLAEKIADSLRAIDGDKLRAIAAKSVEVYASLLADAQDDIQAAIALAVDHADDYDGRIPPVKISHSLSLDLNKDEVRDIVSVSLRHRHESACSIPDPHQPELF
jgi:hypothetical protein